MSDWAINWAGISYLNWSINICLKSTLVLLLALLVTRIMEGFSANYRYAIWKGTFALLLLIPLAGLLPTFSLEYVQPSDNAEQIIAGLPVPYENIFQNNEKLDSKFTGEEIIATPPDNTNAQDISISFYLKLIWSVGTGVFLLLVFMELYYFKRIIRNNKNHLPENWQQVVVFCKNKMSVQTPIKIIHSDELKMPFNFGWKKAFIFLPEESKHWENEKLKTVVLHEMGHIRQNDFITNVFSQLIKAIYWWHPLIWWTAKEMRLECERSCDELVLKNGVSNIDYAQHLVDIAKSVHLPRLQPSFTAIPIIHQSQLKKRVSQILSDNGNQTDFKKYRIIKCLVIILLPLLFFNFKYYPINNSEIPEQVLIEQLITGDHQGQIEAAKILGERRAGSAYSQLVAALKNNDYRVRVTAAWALGQIKNKEAVSELLPLVNDRSDCVKEWALLSLGEFGVNKSFYSVIKTQGHHSPEVRKATLWSLHQIGCLPAFHHICQHLNDSNEEVRILAEQLLKNFPKNKLRYWMRHERDADSRYWAYEHFKGVEKWGRLDLFLHRLAKNENEEKLLEKIILENNSDSVIDEIRKHLK